MSNLRQKSLWTDWDALRKADEMDPQATLYDLLDAIERNDRMDVGELLMALWDWNAKGGFLPDVKRVVNRDSLMLVSRNKSAVAGSTCVDRA